MAQSSTHKFLFEDTFNIKSVDNSRFERAGRIDCTSEDFGENTLELDINNIIWPVSSGEKIFVALTDNVSPVAGQNKLTNAYDHDPRVLGASVMDDFEYVMYGRVYKKEDVKGKNTATVFVSYGGLLMKLKSNSVQLKDFHLGDSLYLLIRKVT
eukprot:CAMPEP_0178439048 /NCGR_PEP_ID=MMETSP0689_2-20121128/35939_1 /TAXON_ID=160604 /ORGANISM="Amphidinium massartii, Strain CS-259" /LENGTH=153 /DNA_ID=CAMNT_0020061533 /DNA_START=62 /DNA_END=523 /DNA_ORIENTATION=-